MNAKTIISAIALTAAMSASAQLPAMAPQIDLDFMREAISPAVKVVRTSYFMADAELTQRYSSQTDTVYGYDYSIVFQTPDGFIVPAGTVEPWLTDPRFEEFRNSTEYTPLLNNRSYAPLSRKPVYENLAPKQFEAPTAIGTDTGLAWLETENVPDGLMQAGFVETETKGFMTWFVLPRGQELQDNTDLNIKFSRFTPEFDAKGQCAMNALPPTNGEILGGIYVQPIPGKDGVINLRIAGVLSRTSPRTGAWRLVRIDTQTATPEQPEEVKDETPAAPDNKDGETKSPDKKDTELKPIE